MEIPNPSRNVTVSEFYKGKIVLITGATGFVGKVLIEKLLRSCPDVEKIYALIRPKKGKSIEERLEFILKDMLFDTLKQTNPSQISKIIPICGDCSELKLGLSDEDYQKITSTVSVIFHVAASVRFDDALKFAILLNTRGTREIAELALKTTGISAFIHVSTTYCNCVVGKNIKEIVYPAPDDWRKAIKLAEEFDSEQLAALTDKYLGSYPNTYTFTKALGEHVVRDLCEGKIPTAIVRPSIVISTLKDPVKGWVDNFNGPVGLLVACGKGLLRCSYQNPDINADYIPVDVTVKIIIVTSWEIAMRKQIDHVEVIHSSNGYNKWMTLGEVIRLGRDMSDEIPLNESIWVPKGFVTRCIYYAYLCTIFFHLLPAFFLDLGLKLAGKKPMLKRLQTKIYNAALQLRYFTWQEWQFENDKMISLEEKILEKDREIWGFDFRMEDASLFMKNCMRGARKYLLKESDDTLPQARIHYKRMYWLDKITMFFLYGSLYWLIVHFNLLDIFTNYISTSFDYYFDNNIA